MDAQSFAAADATVQLGGTRDSRDALSGFRVWGLGCWASVSGLAVWNACKIGCLNMLELMSG